MIIYKYTMNLSEDLSVDKELFSGTLVEENIKIYLFSIDKNYFLMLIGKYELF